MTTTVSKRFADDRESRVCQAFFEISAQLFAPNRRRTGPISFSSSISHHGLNTAPEGDAANSRRNLSSCLRDMA